ncbi:MAG: hypothetical protein P8017_18735 [Deltaproteobacteria bacterium]
MVFFLRFAPLSNRYIPRPYDDPAAALAEMFAGFQLLVFERQGKLQLPENPLLKKYLNRIHTLEAEENLDKISSTEVRRRMSKGRSIAELVPEKVALFIQKHSLYGDFAEE